MLSGSADAMLGGFLNVEGVDLTERGENPRVVPVDELGIPTYDELVLVANSDRVEDDPEAIRLFIAALERGTRGGRARPRGARPRRCSRPATGSSRSSPPRRSTRRCRCCCPTRASPFGYMNAREWVEFGGFFADRNLISTRPAASEMFTDDLLPGRIPE